MIIDIFLSTSTLVQQYLYSPYAVFFCWILYAVLLTWLYYVLFASLPLQASWEQLLQEKITQLFNNRFISK